MHDADVQALTQIVRAADESFEKEGGGTRHWLREQFLPRLEDAGFQLVPASELTRLREGLERVSGIAYALIEHDHIIRERPERIWLADNLSPASIASGVWDIHTIARDALTHGAIE